VRSATIEQCRIKANAGRAPVWLYWFAWQTPILDARPGAFHTAELPFVFNNVKRCDAYTGGSSEAEQLGLKMSRAWAAFARTGNPSHAQLPAWEPYDSRRATTMIFDALCVAQGAPDQAELEALNRGLRS
jgi:para-nitrobenzyl esterase